MLYVHEQVINSASQGGSGGSVQRSESSSQDHPDLSQLSSETASADQVKFVEMCIVYIEPPVTFLAVDNTATF